MVRNWESQRIAVIDVETTGLNPFRHDRIVEIAVVTMRGDGQIEREFVSVVNPERDVGPSSIHGLRAEDVIAAPRFREIAGHVVEALSGAVAIGGHNVRFDRQFLESEFARIGWPLPPMEAFCTMRLCGHRRLGECCKAYGLRWRGKGHDALGDARAAARLLSVVLKADRAVADRLARLDPIPWPAIGRSGRAPVTRGHVRRGQRGRETFLQRIVRRMPDEVGSGPGDEGRAEYMALLDRVLEDRIVEEGEAEALFEVAERWGLSRGDVEACHREYMRRLCDAVMADGVITEAERRDVELAARSLGLEREEVERMLKEANASTGGAPSKRAERDLRGRTVCFTGEFQCCYRGVRISREMAERLAREAGLEVVGSVTKRLDLLVVADPYSQSGKAKKARQYGVRIVYEPVFWRMIGVEAS